jgi:hypothetical protein
MRIAWYGISFHYGILTSPSMGMPCGLPREEIQTLGEKKEAVMKFIGGGVILL